MAPRSESYTTRILVYIRAHPRGVKRRDVVKAFPDVPASSVDNLMARLRTEGLVINNGVKGPEGATWWAKTADFIPEDTQQLAKDLLRGLRQCHREGQELYLAEKLHELLRNDPGVII